MLVVDNRNAYDSRLTISLYTSKVGYTWPNLKVGRTSAVVAKATLEQTCILEKEHATLLVAPVYTLRIGENVYHANLSAIVGTR